MISIKAKIFLCVLLTSFTLTSAQLGDIVDTVTDTTSNVTSPGSIGGNIGGAIDNISSIPTDLGNIGGNIGGITDSVGNIPTDLGNIGGNIGGVTDSVGNIPTDLGNIGGNIGGVTDSIGSLATDLGSIGNISSTSVGTNLGNIGSDVTSNLEGINSRNLGSNVSSFPEAKQLSLSSTLHQIKPSIFSRKLTQKQISQITKNLDVNKHLQGFKQDKRNGLASLFHKDTSLLKEQADIKRLGTTVITLSESLDRVFTLLKKKNKAITNEAKYFSVCDKISQTSLTILSTVKNKKEATYQIVRLILRESARSEYPKNTLRCMLWAVKMAKKQKKPFAENIYNTLLHATKKENVQKKFHSLDLLQKKKRALVSTVDALAPKTKEILFKVEKSKSIVLKKTGYLKLCESIAKVSRKKLRKVSDVSKATDVVAKTILEEVKNTPFPKKSLRLMILALKAKAKVEKNDITALLVLKALGIKVKLGLNVGLSQLGISISIGEEAEEEEEEPEDVSPSQFLNLSEEAPITGGGSSSSDSLGASLASRLFLQDMWVLQENSSGQDGQTDSSSQGTTLEMVVTMKGGKEKVFNLANPGEEEKSPLKLFHLACQDLKISPSKVEKLAVRSKNKTEKSAHKFFVIGKNSQNKFDLLGAGSTDKNNSGLKNQELESPLLKKVFLYATISSPGENSAPLDISLKVKNQGKWQDFSLEKIADGGRIKKFQLTGAGSDGLVAENIEEITMQVQRKTTEGSLPQAVWVIGENEQKDNKLITADPLWIKNYGEDRLLETKTFVSRNLTKAK